jgi:hypothetical protein
MSEGVIGREPVQIVEIVTPKCANVHGSSPCTATETGDFKCFNTRNTCNDVDNFQARPLAHLAADQLYEDGATITAADLTLNADAIIEFDGRFGIDPSGTIAAVGSTTNFLYLGFTGTDLVFAIGGDDPLADQARATVAASAVAGRTVQLIGVIDYTNDRAILYEYDPIELRLVELASATAPTGLPANWAASTDGEVGGSAVAYTGEDGGAFDGGRIEVVRFHDDQTATLDTDPDAYRQRYFFDDGRKARPADDIYILPLLTRVETVGSRINVTGADDRYEPLGRRAFMLAQMADAPHSDFPFDPYLGDRSYNPLDRSTFWAKWVRRNKFGQTRAIARLYTGYNGDRLEDMRSQTYVLDRVTWSRDRADIECRDFLSLTEFRRAQVPEASPGKLNAAILAADTSLTMAGDQTEDYPATGTLRIDEELLTYTSISYDSFTDETTVSGLTRGTDGSTAADHDNEEGVQLCRRYTAARIDDVLEELIVDDAKVPAQIVDLDQFTDVYNENLDAYTLTTLISEPTGVDQLIGEIAEQCSFYVWWDERDQRIRLQAIAPLSGVDIAFTQEAHIIGDSFELTERPKERLTTISAYYNPRDFAGDLSKPVNYKNQLLVSNSSAAGPDQYGRLPQTREIFSRWLTTEAQVNQTLSRYSVRYAEVPRYATFLVDAKDRQYWVGDFCTISHDYLVNARGERDAARRWLIIEAREVEPGHAQMIRCVDVTLDGLIYKITENGIGNYTEALFAQGNAFITDASGLNPDGSPGATIG